DLDLGARVFELLLQRSGVGFVQAFFHGLRRAVDQVLGFFQAQAGSGTDDLDRLDFLLAGGNQDHREFGLLFSRSGSSATASSRRSHRNRGSSGGHAELLFHHFDQFGQFQDRQASDGVKDFFFAQSHFGSLRSM